MYMMGVFDNEANTLYLVAAARFPIASSTNAEKPAPARPVQEAVAGSPSLSGDDIGGTRFRMISRRASVLPRSSMLWPVSSRQSRCTGVHP
jgi:hypothetical protein